MPTSDSWANTTSRDPVRTLSVAPGAGAAAAVVADVAAGHEPEHAPAPVPVPATVRGIHG